MLEPTRGENVLDIGLTSQTEFVDIVKICEPLGCSDHNQILDRLDMRNFSFSQRSVNEWNKLSADCVGVGSGMFKNKINITKYLRMAGCTSIDRLDSQ